MPTAIILGSNGQDGGYLAEVLLARGFSVIGVARQERSRWIEQDAFRHVMLDVADPEALSALLRAHMPSEIYVLAAVHGSSGFAYEPVLQAALAVNVGSVHTCLEHLRRHAPQCRLFLASSLKAFGAPPPPIIDEETPRRSTCLYSITKNAAADLMAYYRAQHGVWASVGFLFNHDSPRRPADYFLPSLAAQLAAYLKDEPSRGALASVDFWCDWGSAREFMQAAADLLQNDLPTDVVIASGMPLYAAHLAAALAAAAGVPKERWLRSVSRPPAEPASPPFHARLDRFRAVIGPTPPSDGLDVAIWILAERHGINLIRPDGWAHRHD